MAARGTFHHSSIDGEGVKGGTPEHALYESGKRYVDTGKFSLALVDFRLCRTRVDDRLAKLEQENVDAANAQRKAQRFRPLRFLAEAQPRNSRFTMGAEGAHATERRTERKTRGVDNAAPHDDDSVHHFGASVAFKHLAEKQAINRKVRRMLVDDFANLDAYIDKCELQLERAEARERVQEIERTRAQERNAAVVFSLASSGVAGGGGGGRALTSDDHSIHTTLSDSTQSRRSVAGRVSQPTLRSSTIRAPRSEKPFDLFISYRVEADAALAEQLYDKLTGLGYRVWWDRTCLEMGTRWEDAFITGLASSACVAAILSRGALARFEQLDASSPVDNLLLEFSLALELQAQGEVAALCPVLVGDLVRSPVAGEMMYVPFFECNGAKPHCRDVAVSAVDAALAEHMQRLGHSPPARAAEGRSVRGVLDAVLSYQGNVVKGLESQALPELVRGLAAAADAAREAAGCTADHTSDCASSWAQEVDPMAC